MSSCHGDKGRILDVSDLNYQNPDGVSVYYFLSPECPLCENYTKDFKDLYNEFYKEGIKFYGIFPGDYYSEERILRYFEEYSLPIIPVLDLEFEMASYYKAEITPECVLVNKEGEILYQGKLDNWLLELGRRKRNIDQYYLKDAIIAHLSGKEVEVKRTTAIGCFIEYKIKR